jgi:Cytotoxic
MSYISPPSVLNAFPEAQQVRPKTFIRGTGKLRKRWKDKENNIYEWDYQHGSVEKYDRGGRHLGEFHPETGLLLKPADPNRRVEP